MVALPNLQVSSNPSTWGGGLTGGGVPNVSMAGAPPVSQAGGGGGTMGSLDPLAGYNPFPKGAATASSAAGATGPAGGWTADNLPGGGAAAQPAKSTYVQPDMNAQAAQSTQTAAQAAVADAIAGKGTLSQVNLPTGATPALATKPGEAAPTQPANTTPMTIQNTQGGPMTVAYMPNGGASALSAIGATEQPPAGSVAALPAGPGQAAPAQPANTTAAYLPNTAGKEYYVPNAPHTSLLPKTNMATSGFGGTPGNNGLANQGLATQGWGSTYAQNPNVMGGVYGYGARSNSAATMGAPGAV